MSRAYGAEGASLLLIHMCLQHSKRSLGAPLLPTSAFNTSGDPSPRCEIAASILIITSDDRVQSWCELVIRIPGVAMEYNCNKALSGCSELTRGGGDSGFHSFQAFELLGSCTSG